MYIAAYSGNLIWHASQCQQGLLRIFVLAISQDYSASRSKAIDYFADVVKDPEILLISVPYTSYTEVLESSSDPILRVDMTFERTCLYPMAICLFIRA